MNSFANPNEAHPYVFPEFSKPESHDSDYSNIEGVQDFKMKGFNSNEAVQVSSKDVPVVHKALLQDFKEVLPAS